MSKSKFITIEPGRKDPIVIISDKVIEKLKQIDESQLSDSFKCGWYYEIIDSIIDSSETPEELARIAVFLDERLKMLEEMQ